VKQQREFFAKRLYISDNADLARLCLAIIAPVSPAHQDFEDVLYDLEQARKGYRMSKNSSQLLRLWIREFQVAKRSTNAKLTRAYWKTDSLPPLTDTHFIGSFFQSFPHQCSIDGRRIGSADCTASNDLPVRTRSERTSSLQQDLGKRQTRTAQANAFCQSSPMRGGLVIALRRHAGT
jgi:hypothetical protein